MVELVPWDDDRDVIGLSPLSLAPLNADFDGDTAAIYVPHCQQALHEMNDKAFILNTIKYDSDDEMLSVVRHESLYCVYVITSHLTPDYSKEPIRIDNLQDLPENDDYYNNKLSNPIIFNGETFTYAIGLINKWCGFNKIIINKTINNKLTNYFSEMLFKFYNNNKNYYDALTLINKKLLYFISSTKYCPSLNIQEMLNMVDDDIDILFKKLPDNNVILGYYINDALISKCLDRFDKESSLYTLYKSGSRFKLAQLARSCINIGYVADAENTIVPKPVRTHLMSGLTPDDFFRASPGSRKGIADKSDFTPQSGYLERTLTMGLSPLEIVEDDCGSYGLEILVFNEKHAKTLIGKYFKDPFNGINSEWEVFDDNHVKPYINRKIIIRSPITCQTPHFRMCQKCFGVRYFPTKYIGIVAAQCLAERFTQLIMQSFHTSGAAELVIYDFIKNFFKDHLLDIEEDSRFIKLYMDTEKIPKEVAKIPGFKNIINNQIIFTKIFEDVKNKDAIAAMTTVKTLLRKQTDECGHPADYYQTMMNAILEVGSPYSSFVEMLFANMFITNTTHMTFWRYDQSSPIVLKLGDKVLATHISKLLGLLYQPNKKSLEGVPSFTQLDFDESSMNIYERIWLGMFK